MTEFLGFFPKIPLLFRSAFDYYRHGPPQPSWDLESYLIFMFMRSLTSEPQSIEAIQRLMSVPTRVISGDIMVKKLLLPNSLRKKSETCIDGILKDYDHVILDDWKSENIGNGLECEWVYVKEKEGNKNHYEKKIYDRVILYLHGGAYCVGSPRSYRICTSRIAKFTKARLFVNEYNLFLLWEKKFQVINYRISPQNQFPAALHDAITAYDYLINPPKDADFLPIDPKNIIIMGDSAGGGLTMATLLAIRDSKSAPLPGGAIVLSPWVDLTHSMPSLLDPITDKSDSVSSKSLHFLMSPVWEKYEQKSMELSEKIRLNVENKPKFWHESLECEGHLHLYASNQGSAIPYVSPLLAESLGDLPPILIQGGDVEKLRDECIYLAFKASDPEKYNSPSYNAKPSKSLPYQTPTKVVLEIYEEMPHVFQLMWRNKSSNIALKRISQFVDQTLSGEETKEKESKFLHVTTKGEIIEGLRKDHYKVLEWKNIGIKHDALVKFCLAIPSDNNSNFTKLFVLYAILLLAILLLINLL